MNVNKSRNKKSRQNERTLTILYRLKIGIKIRLSHQEKKMDKPLLTIRDMNHKYRKDGEKI